MKYRLFEEYSDMSHDEKKFQEEASLAKKIKYGAVKTYNEAMEYGPSTGYASVGAVSFGAAGALLGSGFGPVGAGVSGVAVAGIGIKTGIEMGNEEGYQCQIQDTEAELADEMGKFNDRFLKAARVESRAARAENSLNPGHGEDIFEDHLIGHTTSNALQDNAGSITGEYGGVTDLIEKKSSNIALMYEMHGDTPESTELMAHEYLALYDGVKNVEGRFVDHHHLRPEVEQKDVTLIGNNIYAERQNCPAQVSEDLIKVGELNTADYYAQMQVAKEMVKAEKNGEELSDYEVNTIGQEACEKMDKFMNKSIKPEADKILPEDRDMVEVLNSLQNEDMSRITTALAEFAYDIDDRIREDREGNGIFDKEERLRRDYGMEM
jgi:hypothetical protein